MKTKSHKDCANCGKNFKLYKTTDRWCSLDCKVEYLKKNDKLPKSKQQKPIPKKSKKQKILDSKYIPLRIKFLAKPENKICFVEGCNKKANTIEHRRGREGFADDWARDNNIPLYIDERFFAPCCLDHNLEFERNPELSNKYQLSKIHGGKKGDK